MLIVAGVLVAARMEAGIQKQGEKHTRKLRFTGNGPQAHIGEAEPRITRDKKGKTMRVTNRKYGEKANTILWRSKRKESTKERIRRQKKEERKRTAGNQRQKREAGSGIKQGRHGEKQRAEHEKVRGRAILTKETGGGAGRKSFPHQHILFQKSSKLCWNESERITESQPARERKKGEGVRKRYENVLENGR